MRRIQFEVEDLEDPLTDTLPPKKHGRKSMWNRKTEVNRLKVLRRKALDELGSAPPFTGDIRLTLSVHVGCEAPVFTDAGEKGFGDLDNFVSGVCDGLMAAHPNVVPDPSLWPDGSDIHPTRPLAFLDDARITEINAKKCIGPGKRCWYEIGLEELEGE